ncbi:Wzz/FepE/Etk N-terminal domain-containing protein [Methylobacterium durans]|uniref:tyrosine-protein kinase domain-containing protein n=1 Tax=Methylobacterium durans TaxID=2202825 RepID=UPI002AFE46D2|nr:Wzz/FepE/Etk N-terminal domain-containing protein [Methylobacterium durans]MEA1832109.1 Wzz/FepE/Etk N-terminal domain-containing protein [Methylobacterium durans]
MYDPARRIFAPQPPPPVKDEVVGLREIHQFLRMSNRTILLFVLVFVGAALAYCLITTPIFTATAQIIIEPVRAQSFLQEGNAVETVTDTGRVESQMEVLKSDRIGEIVIRSLGLVDDPEFQPGPPSLLGQVLDLFRPEAEPMSDADREAARLAFALNVLSDRMLVRRVGQSYVVELSVRSKDAAKAASIANAIMSAFIDSDIAAKAEEARRGSTWLNERLAELRDQALHARRDLEQFKSGGESTSATEARVKLAELESTTVSHTKLYDAFLLRYIETAQKVTYPVADARIVAAAAKPLTRSHPKSLLIVAFAGILGGATGVGTAMVRRRFDDRVFTTAAVTRHGVDLLGTVDAVRLRQSPLRATPISSDRLLAIAADMPRTRFAADLRTIKTSINTALLDRAASCLGVTSVSDGEGKSTLAANLAQLFAISGSRTLLIDASPGDPVISRKFAPNAEFGFVQALAYPDTLNRLIAPQPNVPNLFVLPLGTVGERASPIEQMASDRQRLQLDDLRQTYHVVIFDLPSLASAPDARAIAPLLDGMILVAEFGHTTATALESAVRTLEAGRGMLLGAILNKVDRKNRAWTA